MSEIALPFEKLAYGVDEACAALNVGTTKLYQLLTDGKIEDRMEGRRITWDETTGPRVAGVREDAALPAYDDKI